MSKEVGYENERFRITAILVGVVQNFVSHAAFFVSSRNASSQGVLGDKRKTAAEKII